MRGKKNREAKHVPREDKINPQVLRQLIFEIIELEFSGDRGKAANELAVANPVKGKTHLFTRDIISHIIDDRTPIKYFHLEAIAHHFRMPTFVILLFSRLRSEQEKSGQTELSDVSEVQHLISFLQDIEETIADSSFTAEDLRAWGNKYNELRLKI